MERPLKYELTDTIRIVEGVKLHQIRALRDCGNVKTGDLGGFIEKESNLSHFGDSWISGNAQVYGDAQVFDHAKVTDNAKISGHAHVYDRASVSGNAQVYGNATIAGYAQISGDAKVFDKARVSGDVQVTDNAQIFGSALVSDRAYVSGNAQVYGYARVLGETQVSGFSHAYDIASSISAAIPEQVSEEESSEPMDSYNSKFTSKYETKDGKTINYSSERAESYGELSSFDSSGENAGSDEVSMRSGPHNLQRQGDTALYRYNSRLDEESGEFSVVERVFRETGSFNFTSGEKIESADDVAFIFSALEDAAKEHSFVVLVKEGRPTVIELGMGTFTGTMVDVPTASLAYSRINPDQVYFVHNHPSGNLMCSPQDVQMLRKIAGISKVPVYGVIINLKTGKYGTFDTDNKSGIGQKRIPENEIPLTVHTLDKQIFASDYDPMAQPPVRGPQDVAQFLNSHRMGDRAKMSFIVLSRAGRIVGNIHTPFTELPVNSDDIARYISERVIQFGGESAILYGDFTTEESKIVAYQNLKDNLNKVGDIILLDVVNIEGNYTRSASEYGLLREPSHKYEVLPDSRISNQQVKGNAIPEIIKGTNIGREGVDLKKATVADIPGIRSEVLTAVKTSGIDPGKVTNEQWSSLLKGRQTTLGSSSGKLFMLAKAPVGYTLKAVNTVNSLTRSAGMEM